MFRDSKHLDEYVIENYPEVTDNRIDHDHWDLQCTYCKMVRGFQVIKCDISGEPSGRYVGVFDQDFDAPITYLFRCPVCTAFKQWIVYEIELPGESRKLHKHYYRVTSVPPEGLEDVDELPEQPPALRSAYRQAIRAMDANANLAAAAMFRRALQVITRDLLGAKPGNLAGELKEVVGKTYNDATITSNFSDVGYIIKEAGNQGAHPDKDPDLLDFSPQDAEDLQTIFMELVSDLFIVPAATKKAKAEFLARRKIPSKP
jgi:Domain of unknown function (DUF4145)